MSSSFTPPSDLECNDELQLTPNTVFGDNEQSANHQFPQTLATVKQLNGNMPQQRQKRNFWDIDGVDNSMLVRQHYDPTFYGLSASLPMSTYPAPSSPNSQMADKRYRLSNQTAQGDYPPMQRPPQASTSYSNRPVASAHSKSVYNDCTISSRRGMGANELRRPMRHPQHITPDPRMGSGLSTNSYMSDPPPSWNWINQLHPSSTAINMQHQHDDNFTFMWPVLSDELQTLPHSQSTYQVAIKMQQTLVPSYVPISATATAVSYSTPEPPRAFHTLLATPEVSNNYFGHFGAQIDENRPSNPSLGRQGTESSMASQRKPPPELEGKKSNDMYTRPTSGAETSQPDLSHSFNFAAFMFENMPNLDHDFGFDRGLDGDVQEDGDTLNNANEISRDQGEVTLSQYVDKVSATDSYDESAMAKLLRLVASYPSSSGLVSAQEATDDLASHGMSMSDGAGLGEKYYEVSPTASTKSSSSIMETQSIRGLCSAIAEAEPSLRDKYMPTNGPVQGNTRRESTISNTDPATTSPINSSTSISTQTAVLTKPNKSLSPEGHPDVQEWVNRRYSADSGQPVAARLKVPMVDKEAGTYGQQVMWENERSEVDAGQPKDLTPGQKDCCDQS